MKERLTQLFHYLGLNAARFADEIGVQRSGISHILSGRNQPSYDFLVKTLRKFPEINPEWLLIGKGSMLRTDPDMQGPVKTKTEQIEDLAPIAVQTKKVTDVNIVRQVIIFYTNGTFDQYIPAG